MAKFSISSDVRSTLLRWARQLTQGLTFEENFTSYEWEGSIEAGEEKRITHNLDSVPTRFILTDAQGTNLIIRSDTQRPTLKFFFVKNVATTSTFTGKILILP